MRRFTLRLALLGGLILSPLIAPGQDHEEETVEFHGPEIHPGYPDAFHLGYKLRKSAVSPDGKYGIIYPNRLIGENGADFIVALKPSKILGTLEMGDEFYFSGQNHGGIEFYWAPDSSAVAVVHEGKWAPREIFVIEFKDGRVVRQAHVVDSLFKAFAPEIAKAERTSPKETGVGELTLKEIKWVTRPRLQLRFSCDGGTNPKGFAESSQWQGTLDAVWDVGQARLVSQKVKKTSFIPAGKEKQ